MQVRPAPAPAPFTAQYDIPWLHNKPYRMHRFESKKAPIIGFTAYVGRLMSRADRTSDVLIEAARVASRVRRATLQIALKPSRSPSSTVRLAISCRGGD